MLELNSLTDIAALRESVDIECKLAQGRDGKGGLPNDLWETYSAFANTSGGDIFLGLKENKDLSFDLRGVENAEKVLEDFWNNLNNPQKVSFNLLRDSMVTVITIEGMRLIHIHVPQASRQQKPVFVNNNPLTGTFKRLGSGDMKLQRDAVSRLLAEQSEESRDAEILVGYSIEDLDLDSLRVYRNMYSTRAPDHPWNKVDNQEFLIQIGAWRRDRVSGVSGLTRAGLLMFGQYRPIMDAFPNYMVDYQERPEAKTEARWIDRIVPDGTWSGNVFDFYQKVIRKLTADLKVPFTMQGDQRQDDTLVHKALREALVNTLIHADYSGHASILVVKRPDMFGFRNPGLMRVAIESAVQGSESDCRNRILQNLFRFVGLGENAGSGLPKIFDGWKSQHWRQPLLKEKAVPNDQTLLELHALSLVPEKTIHFLRESIGSKEFDCLNETERLILATAHIEGTVDHRRLMQVLDIHPKDLSATFSGLIERSLLLQEGAGRGTIYFLAQARLSDDIKEIFGDDFFDDSKKVVDFNTLTDSSGGLSGRSGGFNNSSGGLSELQLLAEPVASKKKVSKEVVVKTILELCQDKACTLGELASLLKRSTNVIRKDYLQPMLKAKQLFYKYPTKPNHPEQAYRSAKEELENDH
ncbi:putative DNA binding domain-containing protein [Undibacterium amnicola]|uniref:DNA binding domain-containing protein n=1 Tax=Undibacterium amnicola TaxID=1834038 RepID=A0ABR6XQH1_9BURK|nr:RNA-binding domain-containing protein [Undibacterium amnicola]MBC3831730.1 putative DNA binding domain-containing protein [Undibacterium amnicola]